MKNGRSTLGSETRQSTWSPKLLKLKFYNAGNVIRVYQSDSSKEVTKIYRQIMWPQQMSLCFITLACICTPTNTRVFIWKTLINKTTISCLLLQLLINSPPPPLGKVSNFAHCLFITRLRYFNSSIAPIIISIIISELINVTNLNRSFSHQGLKRSLADHGICKSNK